MIVCMYGFFIISYYDVHTHSYFSLLSYWKPTMAASALWGKEKYLLNNLKEKLKNIFFLK